MAATSLVRRSRPRATLRRFAQELFDEKMRERGITEEQAKAAALDVHRATLNRWRSPDRLFRLGLDDANYYADRVGIPVDELFVPVTINAAVAA